MLPRSAQPLKTIASVLVIIIVIGAAAILTRAQSTQTPPASSPAANITAVPGITVGHYTLSERPTGCTVIIAANGAVGGVDVRGGAPGTVETDLLSPENTVERVNAIVLSGGSAFGLASREGVVTFLSERKIGYPTGARAVPIVPGAILYDLGVGGRPDITPGADCGYKAATAAKSGAIDEGNVGAGAGATVGKMQGGNRAMKGGIGSAALQTTDGLIVGAIVATNAVGSIVDPRTGKAVAGVRTADGRGLEDPFALVRRGVLQSAPARLLENTTIGVIATNARLTKAQALKVSQMAHDGMARAIVPSHTPSDGDTLFVLATGDLAGNPNVGTIGSLAAEAVTDAIIRAVRAAKGIPGYPAAGDIR
ncbi:MAG TPA: P1 family peptidase [Vicinamibacterales bacterium]|nr:P1 family peptidase [Vicinamibacterales bacterium]